MKAALQTKANTPSSTPSTFTPVRGGLFQRNAPAGERLGATGECESCCEKKLQRSTHNQSTPSSIYDQSSSRAQAPPIVHDVLRSTGQPLDAESRTFLEPRFSHDFSQVRVHADTKAAQSAKAVDAVAYTVGRHIVFGEKQFSPQTAAGKRLLAHEITHVLQQTESTVKSASPPPNGVEQPGGVFISDDPLLEREADLIEARASRSNLIEHVAAINQQPISKSLQGEVMQRKKAPKTDFGEFETTKFVEADGRGVEITLKFTPDETKVDAKKIALSQSLRKTNAGGAAYALDPNQASKMVASGKSGAGYVIDAPGSTNNPIYWKTKNLGSTQALKDTPDSANATANPTNVGVNTNYELGYCYKEKPTDASKKKHPAGLWDKPQGGKNKGESKMFETTAFAIEGTDTDKYYGSVTWGYKMEGTSAAPTVTMIDIDTASKGTPTSNFLEPAKLWNAGKTQGTLQVTADPEATVLKGDASGTEKLAKNTKLKQLDTVMWGSDPAISAEVLKADGTGSGKLIYIKLPDVKDMGDGSENKKLPIPVPKAAGKTAPPKK